MGESGLGLLRRISASVEAETVRLVLHPWRDSALPLNLITVGDELDLRDRVAAFVYANYYACDPSLAEQADQMVFLGYRRAAPEFVEALSRANPGSGYFSEGWTVAAAAGEDELTVIKDNLSLTAHRDRHLTPDSRNAATTDVVAIRFPKESFGGSPGFYIAFGDAGPASGLEISRFYLNFHAEGATTARTILSALLYQRIPYTWKIAASPDQYARRDNSVLYVRRADYEPVAHILLNFAGEQQQILKDEVPGFTRKLAAGVAVADNPDTEAGPSASFGEHRSGLVAETIANLAQDVGAFDQDTLYQALLDRFRTAGLDPERPYLRHSTAEDYRIPCRL